MANKKALTQGEIITYIEYYKVDSVENFGPNPKVHVYTTDGTPISISKSIVDQNCQSATSVQEEVAITRTDLIEKIAGLGKIAFTVNFNKQVDEKSLKATLEGLYANQAGKIISKTDHAKKVKDIIHSVYKGEERTLTGFLITDAPEMGRFKMIDLQLAFKGDKNPIRLVNQQTINFAIIDSIKYVVK